LGLFEDSESGIASYAWSIGSNPRLTDIMEYTTARDECAETPIIKPVYLKEGHTYFVNVKVN